MKRLPILLPLLLLTGCLSIPRENLEIVRYSFHPMELEEPEESSFDGALMVLPFQANATQRGDRMVYRDEDHERATYFYHRWIAAPQQLLADLITEDMIQSGLFEGGVYQMTTGLTPTHELQGRLVEMYADNREGKEAAVLEVMINVFRIDPVSFNKLLVEQKPYRYRVERNDGTVDSYIPAITEAMSRLLSELRTDMAWILEHGSAKQAYGPRERP